MSRIGKIARLPKAVREELNRRLEDGEQQNRLVEWLNGREDVQAVLKADFDSKPINEPNMTAWVQGGFEDWRRQQESLEAAGRVVDESSELDILAKDRRLADRAADMAALALAEQLMAIRRMEDGAEKRRAVLKIVRGLVRLRKSDREHERGQREAAHAERSAEIHEHWAERAQRRPPENRRTGNGTPRTESPRVQGTIPHPGAPAPKTGQPVASPGTSGLRRTGGEAADGEIEANEMAERGQRLVDRPLDQLSDAELMERLEYLKEVDVGRRRGGGPDPTLPAETLID